MRMRAEALLPSAPLTVSPDPAATQHISALPITLNGTSSVRGGSAEQPCHISFHANMSQQCLRLEVGRQAELGDLFQAVSAER